MFLNRFGKPTEIANLVVFLSSKSFIHIWVKLCNRWWSNKEHFMKVVLVILNIFVSAIFR